MAGTVGTVHVQCRRKPGTVREIWDVTKKGIRIRMEQYREKNKHIL